MVVGRLGADPEVRTVGDSQVLKMRIAASYKPKKDVEHTTWIGCDMWGQRATALSKHLKKGDRVALRGVLFTRDADGKTWVDMRVDELEFAGDSQGKGAGSSSSNGGGESEKAPWD